MKKLAWALFLTTTLFATSGCSGLTFGPQVETRYVLVMPGRPLRILQNTTVQGKLLDDSGQVVNQAIGGWVCMPPEHWDVCRKLLEKNAPAAAPAAPAAPTPAK